MCLPMLFEGYWKETLNKPQFCQNANHFEEGAAGSLDMAQVNGRQRRLEGVRHCLVEDDG